MALLCEKVRDSSGQIHIHQLNHANQLQQQCKYKVPTEKRFMKRYNNSANRYTDNTRIQGWLSEKSIRKVQQKTDNEFVSIKNMYETLLQKEEKLQKDIDGILEHNIISKNRKVHLLLKKWHERAFHPLDIKISKEMNSVDYENLDRQKREQFRNYLTHRNKKGHVFLDIFDTDEYDPLYLNRQRPGPIKAVTEKLRDPLLQQQNERNEEDRVEISCVIGERLTDKQIEDLRLPALPLVPLGRHGTECSTWLDMKLTDIQSKVRARSQARSLGVRNQSTNTCFDEIPLHEEYFELEVFDKKNKWCKRRQFPAKHDTSLQLV